jgi:hypothetical protein
LIGLHDGGRVLRNVLQIQVHLRGKFQFTPIFDVVQVQTILYTVVNASDDDEREKDQRVEEGEFEFSLGVVSGPEHTLI